MFSILSNIRITNSWQAINAQIEEALYAPSIIPKINFRSRAKTTGQLNDDGHNGSGISKERNGEDHLERR